MAPEHPGRGHNGGPPLDDHDGPPWGDGSAYLYACWKKARKAAWRGASHDVVQFRLAKAERLGLTYEEYTLEILERGRHLQIEDRERIAEIKIARGRPGLAAAPAPRRPAPNAQGACRSGT